MDDLKKGKAHAAKVCKCLDRDYPDVTCALTFENPLQLLIATILSAQCTDKRVNMVTPALFKKYPTAAHYTKAKIEDLEKAIQSTGFFRNKAKSIQGCCREIAEHHGGEVPDDIDTLVQLPGVGRKTANVVLGTAMKKATGVVVDTHVTRISRRLGLTAEKDPEKIERDLMQLLPKKKWIDFSHQMIHHGRAVCKARRPDCDHCSMDKICPRIGVED